MRTASQKKAYDRAYYLSHRQQILDRSKAHHRKHQQQTNARQRAYNVRRARWLRAPGSWTQQRFYQSLCRQKGYCGICGEWMAFPRRDHCHATDRARGLLCDRCNRLLGNARDSVEILRKASAYLDGFNMNGVAIIDEKRKAKEGV